MANKSRKIKNGKVLHKGEVYIEDRGLYRYSYTDQKGKRCYKYSKDLSKLREIEEQIKKDVIDGLDLYTRSKATINFFFNRYIATKTELRDSTLTGYMYAYDRYVRNSFGKRKAVEVKYSDVLMFYKSILDSGHSISTVESVHELLHPTFTMAVRDEVLRGNPTEGVMAELKKKTGAKRGVRRALTLEQERRFLEFIDCEEFSYWKPIMTVLFGTGGRIGEITGLCWSNVNWEENCIVIDHSLSYRPSVKDDFRCGYTISEPKTEAGKRTIPLIDKVRDVLRQEWENREEYGYHSTVEIDGYKDFIFTNRFGGLRREQDINRGIHRIVNKYNAKEEVLAAREGRDPEYLPHFSCHVCRHTFCTRLCENETNIKVIQNVMGHADIRTTMEIYAEVSEKKKQDVFKNLNMNDII